MKHPLNIVFVILAIILSACTAAQAAPVPTATSTQPTPLPTVVETPHPGDYICLLQPGMSHPEDNIYQVKIGDRLWGTIEYKGGILSLYGEPGHQLQEQREVDGYQNPPFTTHVTMSHPDTNQTLTTITVTVCANGLFIKQEDAPGAQLSKLNDSSKPSVVTIN